MGSLAAISIGGVVGAFVAMHWLPRQRGLVGLLGILPFTLVPLALAYPTEPWVLLAVYFVSGLCLEPFLVYWSTALQEEIPTETLARVSSVDWMASFALMPLGLALTGWVRPAGRWPAPGRSRWPAPPCRAATHRRPRRR